MLFRPITSRDDSERAFALFKENFVREAKLFSGHTVGFQGGVQQCDVFWHNSLGFWGLFEPLAAKGRYWICFGVEDPTESPMLTITCETNPPIEGINRHCAGAFVKDLEGNLYIAHSGKIGGG